VSAELPDSARLRLAPGVRLHFDRTREAWVLLAPERVLEAEGPVHQVLSRCDGEQTLGGIVAALAKEFSAPPEVIAADVREMLADLLEKRMVVAR
jgi:pyrroloquinoline quinone biosynthesis protein D